MRLEPAFSARELLRRGSYGPFIPPTPIPFKIISLWKGNVLVGEGDDMVLENYEEIADLLPLATAIDALVAIRGGIAPEGKE